VIWCLSKNELIHLYSDQVLSKSCHDSKRTTQGTQILSTNCVTIWLPGTHYSSLPKNCVTLYKSCHDSLFFEKSFLSQITTDFYTHLVQRTCDAYFKPIAFSSFKSIEYVEIAIHWDTNIFGSRWTIFEKRYQDHFLYSSLVYKISSASLNFIYHETSRSEKCGMDRKKFGCGIKTSYVLPCACMLLEIFIIRGIFIRYICVSKIPYVHLLCILHVCIIFY